MYLKFSFQFFLEVFVQKLIYLIDYIPNAENNTTLKIQISILCDYTPLKNDLYFISFEPDTSIFDSPIL